MASNPDTIFALSSGAPPAGIAVIRVSGPAAARVATALAGPLPAPRRAVLRRITLGEELIDQGLLLWFPEQSGSITGEDLAEFHVHGGRAVVARLLAVLGAQPGLRLAEAGEFSRRALLNGRIGLVQAEALSDLLLADTETERRAALGAFDGALGSRIEGWRRALVALSAEAEALLDYSDEGDVAEGAGDAHLRAQLAALGGELAAMLGQPTSEELREGVSVVLAGPPNSGKSSLFNALVGRDAAIVTATAGTTRDVIELPMVVSGQRIRLIDTAGVRETADEIEAIGIARARRAAAVGDLVIWTGDGPPPEMSDNLLHIHARCDAPGREQPSGRLAVAASGTGITALLDWVAERAAAVQHCGAGVVLNARQREAVRELSGHLAHAAAQHDLLVIAESLRQGRLVLDRLTGHADLAAVMDELFGRFCVGK
ncbi:tRNA uridine-5-carboxymethylaminomethyl(34) synthesis GTPase MnmE [Sphingomonas quercus]|uniref:tRNA modification GTPase MnmE n=1 Tax=Sphingomonas quercus TaxID=2842451 RepID=A0ABS6BF47_9SPHN|nr:tRNA uridine-5-carboxymethylaminomethyl(34) synthesis GTPase MnmE [Sphingomonas quercus]